MTPPKPVLLVILDGWGVAPPGPGNAVALAQPACFTRLWSSQPHTTLQAGGEAVGLPAGQFGNSEVGHLNLGAGRVVWQDITRIDKDIREGGFFRNEALLGAAQRAKQGNALHLMGLVSDGGVHSSDRHYLALLELLRREDVPGDRVFFHAITDGRDTSPNGGARYLQQLQQAIQATGMGRIATVCGRYFAMDRDNRWDRTEKAYDAYTLGAAEVVADAVDAVEASYAAGVTDEFLPPRMVVSHNEPLGILRDGDAVLWFNFRADRARQMCRALTLPEFDGFVRKRRVDVALATMTPYADDIPAAVAYRPQSMANTLGQWLGRQGVAQFRCAETEKYAHVTYFFNGGKEAPDAGEERRLVPSPKVATYDLQPEMSAGQVADEVCAALRTGRFPFVLVNFANPDMTGHTGMLPAAVAGVKAADQALERVLAAAAERGYTALVTADHGNAEEMLVAPGQAAQGGEYVAPTAAPGADGKVASTQHSHNPVPCLLVGHRNRLREGGALADVAPTVLQLMGLPQPPEMTGNSLLA